MKRWLSLICVSILIVILQLNLLSYSVNAVFVSAAVIAFILPLRQSLFLSILQAAIVDLLTPTPFGIYMICVIFIIVIIKLFRSNWLKQNSALAISVIGVISLGFAQSLFIAIPTLLLNVHWIALRAIPNLSLWGWLIGLAIECIVVNVLVRALTVYQKFVLV